MKGWLAWVTDKLKKHPVALAFGIILLLTLAIFISFICYDGTEENPYIFDIKFWQDSGPDGIRNLTWTIGTVFAAVMGFLGAYLATRRTEELARQNNLEQESHKLAKENRFEDDLTKMMERLAEGRSLQEHKHTLLYLERMFKRASVNVDMDSIINVVCNFVSGCAGRQSSDPKEEESLDNDRIARVKEAIKFFERIIPREEREFFPIDFSELNLADFDFSFRVFSGGNFRRSILRHIPHSDFYLANLLGADLSGANLSSARFAGSNLTGATLCDANLVDADFLHAHLNNTDLSRASLNGANFSNAHLNNANLSSANLLDANFSNADFSNADLSNTDFNNTNLSGARLANTNLLSAGFVGANLSNANLSNANLSSTHFFSADCKQANLSNADVSDADFYGVLNLHQWQIDEAVYKKGKPPKDLPKGLNLKESKRKKERRSLLGDEHLILPPEHQEKKPE